MLHNVRMDQQIDLQDLWRDWRTKLAGQSSVTLTRTPRLARSAKKRTGSTNVPCRHNPGLRNRAVEILPQAGHRGSGGREHRDRS